MPQGAWAIDMRVTSCERCVADGLCDNNDEVISPERAARRRKIETEKTNSTYKRVDVASSSLLP